MMSEPIKFYATVYKVQTLVDFGLRITFDLPQDAIMQAAMLMECHKMGVVLEVDAIPTVQHGPTANTPEGKKARPQKISARAE
jgi:hypothetical protein